MVLFLAMNHGENWHVLRFAYDLFHDSVLFLEMCLSAYLHRPLIILTWIPSMFAWNLCGELDAQLKLYMDFRRQSSEAVYLLLCLSPVSLNDGHIFDIIFSDEYIMDIVGALECEHILLTSSVVLLLRMIVTCHLISCSGFSCMFCSVCFMNIY